MRYLCKVEDIPNEQAKGFTLDEYNLFAVKRSGQIYIYLNQCPHLGIPLEWQEDQFLNSEGELIQCSTHNALFVIETGECVAGPCVGKGLVSITQEIRGEEVWVGI